MKNKILKEINSFSALLYTFGKVNDDEPLKNIILNTVEEIIERFKK